MIQVKLHSFLFAGRGAPRRTLPGGGDTSGVGDRDDPEEEEDHQDEGHQEERAAQPRSSEPPGGGLGSKHSIVVTPRAVLTPRELIIGAGRTHQAPAAAADAAAASEPPRPPSSLDVSESSGRGQHGAAAPGMVVVVDDGRSSGGCALETQDDGGGVGSSESLPGVVNARRLGRASKQLPRRRAVILTPRDQTAAPATKTTPGVIDCEDAAGGFSSCSSSLSHDEGEGDTGGGGTGGGGWATSRQLSVAGHDRSNPHLESSNTRAAGGCCRLCRRVLLAHIAVDRSSLVVIPLYCHSW